MSSFDKNQTRKETRRMKTKATAKKKKMMTTQTTATRSEHGTSYRKTAVEENQSGCASSSRDRWKSREPSRAYSQCHEPWCAVGWLPRRDKGWERVCNSIPPRASTIPSHLDRCPRR